jgi:DUF971 family protein
MMPSSSQSYSHPLETQRRSFVAQRLVDMASSKLDRISKTIAKKVFVLGTEEHRVTESKRPFEKKNTMQESLAERLELQRTTRSALTPTTLRVSKCRQYLIINWSPKKATEELTTDSVSPNSAAGMHMPNSAAFYSTPHRATLKSPTMVTPPPTRLLAELMRAQSCSTDVIGSGVLIYGKRGLTITEVVPHGNYAVRLEFSDNHSGGIFPYDYLHHLGGGEGRKFGIMREYIKALREKKKPRVPPVKRIVSPKRPSSAQGAAPSCAKR